MLIMLIMICIQKLYDFLQKDMSTKKSQTKDTVTMKNVLKFRTYLARAIVAFTLYFYVQKEKNSVVLLFWLFGGRYFIFE